MNIIPLSLRQLFGFTRRERRSSFVVVVIIILVYLLRYVFPSVPFTAEEISVVSDLAGEGVVRLETASDAREEQSILPRPAGGKTRFYGSLPSDTASYRGAGRQRKALLDLNISDSAELESLPGIGPVLAVRTIKYRTLLGGYYNKEQIKEVYGLSMEVYSEIAGRITADTSKLIKFDINTADYSQLLRHPYLESYDVVSIIKYRELVGSIRSMRDISENKLIDSSRLEKIRPYIKFE